MSGAGSSSSRDADEALRSTTGRANFQRVTRLLISGGTRLLRDTFDTIYRPSILPLRLNDPAVKKALKAAKLTKPQRDCLYPSPGVYGNSTDFDITLLSRLLRTICLLSPPPTGWDDLPNSTDHSLTADLVRVKFYRNSVYGHVNENMEIPDDEFSRLWKEIREVLVRIAGHISVDKRDEWQKAIKTFLKDPLTPEDKRNVDELMTWYTNDMDVKKSIEELKSASARLEERMSQLLGNTPRSSSSGSPSAGVHLHVHLSFDATTEKQAMLEKLAMRCLTVDASRPEELNGFVEYLERVRNVLLVDVEPGSVKLTVECRTLQILEALWEDYCTGHLEEMAQKLLERADILKEVGLLAVKIKVNILEGEYMAYKEHFLLKSGKKMMWRKVGTPQYVINSTTKIVTARMASKAVTSSYPTIQPHWVSKATDICAVDDSVYIIRSDLNCYMVTNDLNRGKDIAVHALHPACQGGDHYLANYKGFYIVKGDIVRFVQNLTTDQDSKLFTLHPSNLGATHYASSSIYDVDSGFIIIWADQGKGRMVQYLNTDKEGRDFSLANDCKGGLYYWGNDYFGVSFLKPVSQWGVTYHSTANLETGGDPQVLSVNPDIIPFLPGGLTVAQGPSYGRWELIKSFQNSSHTTFKWEQTIKSTVGYNKSELKSIESHWDVKTSAHCEPGDLTAAIAKMEVSMEASYGGSISKISEEAWTNSTEEEKTISVDIPPGETVYIWQYQVGFGNKPVLFARDIIATVSADPRTDDPFKTDKK